MKQIWRVHKMAHVNARILAYSTIIFFLICLASTSIPIILQVQLINCTHLKEMKKQIKKYGEINETKCKTLNS